MKKKKLLALVLSTTLVAGCIIGGTIAWLTDRTDTVQNTFTVGNVDISLVETTGDTYKMIPGTILAKDPKVIVEADSEPCWLFVKVEESTDSKFDDYMEYTIADGWFELSGNDGVYYREVEVSTADQEFEVLKDNQVEVKESVTKAMMDVLEADSEKLPTLTITAYAAQKEGLTVEQAWTEVQK